MVNREIYDDIQYLLLNLNDSGSSAPQVAKLKRTLTEFLNQRPSKPFDITIYIKSIEMLVDNKEDKVPIVFYDGLENDIIMAVHNIILDKGCPAEFEDHMMKITPSGS